MLAVNLFGEHDSWAGTDDMTFLTENAARDLFAGLDVRFWNETEEDGPAFSGPKHWHVFDVLAIRPGETIVTAPSSPRSHKPL